MSPLFFLALLITPEERAIHYLQTDVPRWSRDNGCYSCHHNGDAARALFLAQRKGYSIDPTALAGTRQWLAAPDQWERHRGSPAFSDPRLASIQFAAAARDSRSASLEPAAAQVAKHQAPDGSWPVEQPENLGSPVTYGAALATADARRTLHAAAPARFAAEIRAADAWLDRAQARSTVDAAALVQTGRLSALPILRAAQNSDGGFGPYRQAPTETFDTAIALLALVAAAHPDDLKPRESARAYLIRQQRPAGDWEETTRPSGSQSYAQRTSTTAWALMALLASAPPSYAQVEPILQRHCQPCHRPGEIGPMPLTAYAQVRPWAKAIRQAVTLRKMPPWFAASGSLHFANDASLSQDDIATIRDWVDAGAPAGSVTVTKAAPSPAPFTPDLVLRAPRPFPVPAGAVIEYQYLILPVPGKAERWVNRVEIRPSARQVVHHIVAYVREAGSPWLAASPRNVMHVPPPDQRTTKADILAVYTPGARRVELPAGFAKKLPAGADIVLQFHYTAATKAAFDQTAIALGFAQEPPMKQVLTLQMGVDEIEIPPGERNYRATVSGTLPNDALLVSLMPHMHLRGRRFDFEIAGEGGRVESLLRVEPFDFHWQLTYWLDRPRPLARGTRLRWTAYFDNSAANARNPDPTATVRWGEQSWQEMMIGFFDVAVDPAVGKSAFFVR